MRPSLEQPRSALVQAGRQLVGPPKQQPAGTLHTTGPYLPENPLIGYSEGERQRKLYKDEFMKHAHSQAAGSINDVKERSRSKSRRARYEALRQRAVQEEQESSLVDIMNRTKAFNSPNRLALKQRYAYSRSGNVARAAGASPIGQMILD